MNLNSRVTGLGWTFTDIPSQAGKRAVVTGGNSGIGFEVCRQLLNHGLSDLVIASRNEKLLEQAAEDLREEFPHAHIAFSHLDLADFGSVRQFAEELLSTNKPIHLLINNGGRYIDTPFEVTEDGFEITLKTNYYGHVYLTQLLLPRLAESGAARIVLVASAAEAVGKLDWRDLKGAHVETSGMPAYGRTKLFMLMYALELHRRVQAAGMDIDVYATYPGVVTTSLLSVKVDFRYALGIGSFLAGPTWGLTPVAGSMSTLYAVTQPNLKGGIYIGPSYLLNTFTTRVIRTPWNRAARDPQARMRLFDETLDIIQQATGHKVPSLPAPAGLQN